MRWGCSVALVSWLSCWIDNRVGLSCDRDPGYKGLCDEKFLLKGISLFKPL
jgi:hypothetical protein